MARNRHFTYILIFIYLFIGIPLMAVISLFQWRSLPGHSSLLFVVFVCNCVIALYSMTSALSLFKHTTESFFYIKKLILLIIAAELFFMFISLTLNDFIFRTELMLKVKLIVFALVKLGIQVGILSAIYYYFKTSSFIRETFGENMRPLTSKSPLAFNKSFAGVITLIVCIFFVMTIELLSYHYSFLPFRYSFGFSFTTDFVFVSNQTAMILLKSVILILLFVFIKKVIYIPFIWVGISTNITFLFHRLEIIRNNGTAFGDEKRLIVLSIVEALLFIIMFIVIFKYKPLSFLKITALIFLYKVGVVLSGQIIYADIRALLHYMYVYELIKIIIFSYIGALFVTIGMRS